MKIDLPSLIYCLVFSHFDWKSLSVFELSELQSVAVHEHYIGLGAYMAETKQNKTK